MKIAGFPSFVLPRGGRHGGSKSKSKSKSKESKSKSKTRTYG
jgi:hypothetical protein